MNYLFKLFDILAWIIQSGGFDTKHLKKKKIIIYIFFFVKVRQTEKLKCLFTTWLFALLPVMTQKIGSLLKINMGKTHML